VNPEAGGAGGAARVALVDDHVLFRDGLREILEADGTFAVVGEAGGSDEALSMVRATQPDLILLDVEIPGDHVTTTVRRILDLLPGSRIIIVSMYDDSDIVQNLITLGVRGYLLKSIGRHELLSSIRGVLQDSERIVMSISRSCLSRLHGTREEVLTDRELEVMKLAAKALSNAQIARELVLTEATVKRHMHKAFVKLGAVSRVDAVNKAVAASLIPRAVLG
jgi:DNA-binding NarL/FixJ family response regulator